MIIFWTISAALGVIVALILYLSVARARAAQAPTAAYDLQIYRDQLAEIDRDLARGAILPEDADRARAEVSRRLLEADRALGQGDGAAQEPAFGRVAIGAAAVGVLAITALGYAYLGAPGYSDLPIGPRIAAIEAARDARPGQATAEAQVTARPARPENPELEAQVARLRAIMPNRPDDPQGWYLLARNEANLGNFTAAHTAQARLIDLMGAQATATQYADHAEMMILAAGGYVSPEAEAALAAALARQPENGSARYYLGLMYAQQGRPDLAYDIWRNLLAQSTPEAPWLEPIRLQIEEVAFLAGTPVALADLPQPTAAPTRGPSAADIEAMEGMDPTARAQFIEGMVANLAARLSGEGGTPEEWAQLIRALVVLGRADEARGILAEAQATFADAPEALAVILEAASGLTP